MKRLTGKLSRPFAVSLLLFFVLMLVVTGQAQQRTVERTQAGPAQIKVDTRNATVAYIEGDHLVVRLEDGRLEAIRIPAEERFNIDGEKHTLHELKPGMILTDESFTTEQPMIVKTVEITDGKVFYAGPRRLVIHTKEGKAVDYRIPDWATITINGEEESLHELRRGQSITATITTEEPMVVVNREKRSHGHHALAELPTRAREAALVTTPETQTAANLPAESQRPVKTEEKLPGTASQIPLIGLLGLLAIAISLGLRAFRKA